MLVDQATVDTVLAAGWGQLLRAVLTLIAALVGQRLALNWTGRAMRRGRVDTGTQILVKRAIVVSCVVITVLLVLGILGVSPGGLVAVAGAVGLAFSLAMQDILKNFFAGVYLLLERPFRVGDTIHVKEREGVVENIGVRTTVLRTTDNIEVLVPNALVFAEVVQNKTYATPKPEPTPPPVSADDGPPEASRARATPTAT
jgi:small-conductance mechanosensitive channel